MRYMLAVLFPPLALLLCGRVMSAIFCLLLMFTLVGWIPAAIWAWTAITQTENERRHRELLQVVAHSGREARKAAR